MTAVARHSPRSTRLRWAILLGLSVLFHALVLGGLSLGRPLAHGHAETSAMPVTLVDPPPFVRAAPSPSGPEPKPSAVRAVVLADMQPRYAAAKAATGDARDAADLFGPVFADGLWPRPVLVGSQPCDPRDDPERAEACRRELLIVGLASDAVARSKAQP